MNKCVIVTADIRNWIIEHVLVDRNSRNIATVYLIFPVFDTV